MKKVKDALVKKVTPIMLAGMILLGTTSSLTGCFNSSGNSNEKFTNEREPLFSTKEEQPIIETAPPKEWETESGTDEIEEPFDYNQAWQDWVEEISKGNFSLDLPGVGLYDITKDVVKYQGEDETVYYVFDNDSTYEVYSTDGEIFNKRDSQVLSPDEFFVESLKSANLQAYDKNSKEFSVEIIDKSYKIVINQDNSAVITGEANANIKNVGSVKNIEVPVVESAPLYTIDENGNWIFDCGLIGQIVENWMKGDNQYGMPYTKYKSLQLGGQDNGIELIKLLWVEASKEEILIYTLDSYPNEGYRINVLTFGQNKYEKDFYPNLQSGKIKTAEDLINHMWTHSDFGAHSTFKSSGTIQYTSIDEDYETKQQRVAMEMQEKFEDLFGPMTEKECFDLLTEKVFDRIENVGTHSRFDEIDPNSTMDGFKDANVLFSFMGRFGPQGFGYGLGISIGWTQYYLLERNGQLELVSFAIESSTYNPSSKGICFTNVLLNDESIANEKNWLITNVNVREYDNSNVKLWEENTKTAENVREMS